MPIDRNLKKKKKREEKKKAKRQETEKQARLEAAEDYEWYARNAYRQGEWAQALLWAQKKLKVHPDDFDMRRLALSCASKLGDESTTFVILQRLWLARKLTYRDELLVFANLSYDRKEFKTASEALELLFSDSPQLKGQLTKTKLKEAEKTLTFTQMMLRAEAFEARSSRKTKAAAPAAKPQPTSGPKAASNTESEKEQPAAPTPHAPPPPPAPKLPELAITFTTVPDPVLEAVNAQRKTSPVNLDLAVKAYRLSFRTSYDQLICLPTLHDVQSFWYQEETVRKVMKSFRGRAILADEVGLGKTIEAGLILKEYIMRGLIRSALILAPSSLVAQWQEELRAKFDIPVVSSNDPAFRQDPDRFWEEPFILASIQTAKLKRHFDTVTSRSYDMVIVDEAHHLKNRTTLNWKLVNAIQKTFLLMLTATPVQTASRSSTTW